MIIALLIFKPMKGETATIITGSSPLIDLFVVGVGKKLVYFIIQKILYFVEKALNFHSLRSSVSRMGRSSMRNLGGCSSNSSNCSRKRLTSAVRQRFLGEYRVIWRLFFTLSYVRRPKPAMIRMIPSTLVCSQLSAPRPRLHNP